MEEPSTVAGAPAAADEAATGVASAAPPAWAVVLAAALFAATVVRIGFTADAFAWAVVQVVLVGVAVYDLSNRRIKNSVTVPVSVLALVLRAIFERSDLVEVLISGGIAFLAFFALAMIVREGLGMGDVKLAAMLGFLLGEHVVAALFIGAIAGGIGAAIVLRRSTGRRATMAYGPYLALGAAAAILLSHPPHLV
jgi:leader peptidase (prepilin peptidase)/N-methyltransferase